MGTYCDLCYDKRDWDNGDETWYTSKCHNELNYCPACIDDAETCCVHCGGDMQIEAVK